MVNEAAGSLELQTRFNIDDSDDPKIQECKSKTEIVDYYDRVERLLKRPNQSEFDKRGLQYELDSIEHRLRKVKRGLLY